MGVARLILKKSRHYKLLSFVNNHSFCLVRRLAEGRLEDLEKVLPEHSSKAELVPPLEEEQVFESVSLKFQCLAKLI